MTLYRIYQQTA